MSAINWAVCPQCARQEIDRYRERLQCADDSYGKATIIEYERRRSDVGTPGPIDPTLREDYEFWIDDIGGLFHAQYKAECNVCGFSYEFIHEGPTSETTLDPLTN